MEGEENKSYQHDDITDKRNNNGKIKATDNDSASSIRRKSRDDKDATSKVSSSLSSIRSKKSRDDEDATSKVSSEFVVPRTIGLMGGISFIVGTIIGSGIFISPRGIARGSGSVGLTMVNWVICGVISTLGALCYAELGIVIKDSGADYAYIHEGYGGIVSYMFSWVNNLLVKPASLGLITLTCAEYIMTPLFDDGCGDAPMYLRKILAVIVVFILAAVNVYSVTLAKRVQIIFTFSKLIALSIVIIGGIVKLAQGYTDNLATGFAGTETNPGSIALGLYSGMWAYDGWNTANFMTEEIINPKRNLTLAICIGMPIVIIMYVMTNISYFTVMTIEEITSSPAVAITWANRVIPEAAWIIPIFVALSTFGTGNGSLFSGGRLMYASARNEHMPEFIAMVHVRKFTPVPAVALSVTLAVIFLLPADIGTLIDFIGFLQWIFYGMAIFTCVIFRYKEPYKHADRPFKVPLLIPIIATLAAIFLVIAPIIADPQIEFLYAAVLIAIGYILYIPLVHFRIRFKFMLAVTKFFQLFFQTIKAEQAKDD